MDMKDRRFLVTGGAGFVGSHLVDALMRNGATVTVLDNLSYGSKENLGHWIGHPNLTLVIGDCLDLGDIRKAIHKCEVVFHLAANPDVRAGEVDTRIDLEQNVLSTHNLLEEMRRSEVAKTIAFTSSSTVYGEAAVIPTPESYGPLKPISLYGASKLACEAFISAYCHMFDTKGVVYRFANIVGSRSRHGVIWDFIKKLRANPRELEILGDGRQTKSYLLVEDCVEAFLLGLEKAGDRFEILNVGSEDRVNVTTIAGIVAESMGLKKVSFRYKGEVEGGRGWLGDVRSMLLDISKLKSLGWKPKHNSYESIVKASKQRLKEVGYHR